MDDLLRQSEVHKLLKEEGLLTIGRKSFSGLVNGGKIPVFTTVGADERKMFKYDDVANALLKGGYGKPTAKSKLIEAKVSKAEEEFIIRANTGDDKEELISSLHEAYVTFKEEQTLTNANIINAILKSMRDKLKLDEEKGLVIARAEVEDKAFVVARSIRNKLLTLPERIANELAVVSDAHTIKEMLYAEFELVLTGLSKDSFI